MATNFLKNLKNVYAEEGFTMIRKIKVVRVKNFELSKLVACHRSCDECTGPTDTHCTRCPTNSLHKELTEETSSLESPYAEEDDEYEIKLADEKE
jgi:hypothetical protein